MPTIRQKKAFAKTLENGGVVSSAMLEADYSPAMAKNPQKLTESLGWQELMKIYLPDDKLARKHEQLLEDDEANVQVKALDMAYKLKGSYAPEKSVNLNLSGEIRHLDPKAVELKEEYERKLLETIQKDG